MQADSNRQEDGRRNRRNRLTEEDFELPDLTWPSYLRYAYVPQADPLVSKVYFNNLALDALRLVIRYKSFADTAELMSASSSGKKTAPDTASFRLSMSPSTLFFEDSMLLSFNFPVVGEDWSKARVLEIAVDEEGKRDTVEVAISNTCLKKIYPNRYCLAYAWKPGREYSVFVPSACFTDYFGRLVDTSFSTVRVPSLETYGQVGLRVQGMDTSARYLIQMVASGQDRTVIFSDELPKDGRMDYPYVSPGNISFVLIRDDNRNGVWDGGIYLDRIQPERRWFFPKTLQVEADWRIEETWQLK